MVAPERGIPGEVIDEADVIPAASATSVERELEQARADRAQAREAETRERWRAGMLREQLLAPLELVEQRLRELSPLLDDLARRRRLLPRVVALAQTVLDTGLSREWTARVQALHRDMMAEPLLVGNQPAAKRLLEQIHTFDPRGFHVWQDPTSGVISQPQAGYFEEWRRQLRWYTAPVGGPTADRCTHALEQLEREVLAEIHARQEAERGSTLRRDATGRFVKEETA